MIKKFNEYNENFYLKENIDYDLIGKMMKDAGRGDIMNTEKVEEFENSEYFKNNRLITIFKPGYEKEYAEHFNTYMTGISDGSIDDMNESVEQQPYFQFREHISNLKNEINETLQNYMNANTSCSNHDMVAMIYDDEIQDKVEKLSQLFLNNLEWNKCI